MYYLNHVTLRRSAPRCPGRVGWLPLCVRTDGRVEVCSKPVPTLVEPCTFVQWMLKEQHPHQTFGQWPVAPTSIGWPSWPAIDRARPCECHGTITHVTRAERASRSWSAMDDDGTGRRVRNERNRDALGTTELTPTKSKRQATAGDNPEGGAIAAEIEPLGHAGDGAMATDSSGGGAAAAAPASSCDEPDAGDCAAVGAGTFVRLYIRMFALLRVRAGVLSVLDQNRCSPPSVPRSKSCTITPKS